MSYTINNISVVPPVGSVVAHTSNTIPSGWLLCDGTQYSKSAYPELSTLLVGSYGNTSSGTTFVVPNFQAAFLRGAGIQQFPKDTGTIYGYNTNSDDPTVNDIRQINTAQGTTTKIHSHTASSNHSHPITSTPHSHSTSCADHNHQYNYSFVLWGPSGMPFWNKETLNVQGYYPYTPYAGDAAVNNTGINVFGTDINSTYCSFQNSTPVVSINNTTVSSNETIPFNYAINWIIKY
jgi:microcystin-dependent protein